MARSSGSGSGQRSILTELSTLTDGQPNNEENSSFPVTPPSPSEAFILQRAHQRKSATYRFNAPDKVFFKSPTNSPPPKDVFQRLLSPTRSPPRKKLNFSPETQQQSEAGPSGLNKLANKRLHLPNMKHSVDVEKNIIALSHAQLVQLINDTTQKLPFVKETMSSLTPEPDLVPVEERLTFLQRTVLRTRPRNTWGNQNGSFCYLRIRAHLEVFKKECLAYGRQFMESQHWPSVFEYILIAWKLTLGLPDWEAAVHNKVKRECIKYLSSTFITAMKMSAIDKDSLNELIERLEELGNDSVTNCIVFAKNQNSSD